MYQSTENSRAYTTRDAVRDRRRYARELDKLGPDRPHAEPNWDDFALTMDERRAAGRKLRDAA